MVLASLLIDLCEGADSVSSDDNDNDSNYVCIRTLLAQYSINNLSFSPTSSLLFFFFSSPVTVIVCVVFYMTTTHY